MEAFFGFLKIFFIGLFALVAVFMILLAMPQSQLRSFVLEVTGWGTAAASAVYVVSPLDLVPDLLPVLGWGDDLVAAVVAACSVVMALVMRRERHRLAREAEPARRLGR
ncbi:YkvA family protein [Longimicrobium sp.]|uniref:YkvA family protein n=1 Tax=Longimicrobium sp. TaxID=2029185 RepID=UPI002E356266|nr:YkvA family protein [Longimicrobium sp.]HEX6041654.1 YkvA family protein [Longimicrobium sp.]